MNPNDTSQKNQCHGGHGHHTIVEITRVVGSLGNDLETQQTTTSEKLADRSNEHKDEGIAQAVAQAVEE